MFDSDAIGCYFDFGEVVHSNLASRLGIDNDPSPEQIGNAKRLAHTLLDPTRAYFGPLRVNSWFRCLELNSRIPGSSNTSAHVEALAADIRPVDRDVKLYTIMNWIIAQPDLPFDQVIYEYGRWLHVGAARDGRVPRRQTLMKFTGTVYLPYDRDDERVIR
jgi:hypothetical protein